MSAIAFLPHHDDELFCAYTLLEHKPLVVVVFGLAQYQTRFGISHETRREETSRSMDVLGLQWDELAIADDIPDRSARAQGLVVKACMEELYESGRWDHVIAPAWEQDGHEGHNMVASCATQVYGSNVTRYMTYRRGHGRSRSKNEVMPKPGWIARKMRALACYESQIELDNTRSWFTTDWHREWLA